MVAGETKTSMSAPSTTIAAATTTTATADSVRVPGDCNTLKEAVKKVHEDGCLTTIVLGEGEHQIDGNESYLVIESAMNIVGDPVLPKEKIVVVGGIRFEKVIQKKVGKGTTCPV